MMVNVTTFLYNTFTLFSLFMGENEKKKLVAFSVKLHIV